MVATILIIFVTNQISHNRQHEATQEIRPVEGKDHPKHLVTIQ